MLIYCFSSLVPQFASMNSHRSLFSDNRQFPAAHPSPDFIIYANDAERAQKRQHCKLRQLKAEINNFNGLFIRPSVELLEEFFINKKLKICVTFSREVN